MGVNSALRKEGIEVIGPLKTLEINRIASTISEKLCTAFPEHNLNQSELFSAIAHLNMYVAAIPGNQAVAKYFYKNSSIYFSNKMNLEDLNTLAIHECIHYLQEQKSRSGNLLRMGLYNLQGIKETGMALNEAAVQLMASKALGFKTDNVKYYGLEISTESPDYYPLQTALIKEISYFTGSYPLFHSTLFSDDVFKNTLVAKSSEKTYNYLCQNFDLLVYYESELSRLSEKLSEISVYQSDNKTIKSLNQKINELKQKIVDITLETQNIIIHDCSHSELNQVRDMESLKAFRTRMYDLKDYIIKNDSYTYYNNLYIELMNRLEEKRVLIEKYGILSIADNGEKELSLVQKTEYNLSFFKKLIKKLSLLVEEKLRQKDM